MATMPQYWFPKLRILVVLKRQYKIVLKLHKNARFKTAFSSNFVTKIHNFCNNNPLFCIFETIFGGLIRYKGTPRNISFYYINTNKMNFCIASTCQNELKKRFLHNFITSTRIKWIFVLHLLVKMNRKKDSYTILLHQHE